MTAIKNKGDRKYKEERKEFFKCPPLLSFSPSPFFFSLHFFKKEIQIPNRKFKGKEIQISHMGNSSIEKFKLKKQTRKDRNRQ